MGYTEYGLIRYPRDVWDEMQRDAAPVHHVCRLCGHKASETCGEVEIPLGNDEWWYMPIERCEACGVLLDVEGS